MHKIILSMEQWFEDISSKFRDFQKRKLQITKFEEESILVTHHLMSDPHLLKKNCFICFNKSPLKMMKNAFYFIFKALFVLKIFKFLSWFFDDVEKTALLEQLNLKIYVVTNLLTITIHMLTNILQSKGKQTIKFGQLIKCNNRNSRIMQLMRQKD